MENMFNLSGLESIAIPVEEVAVRHFFMEFLQEPEVMVLLRSGCVVMAVSVALIYRYMKKKSGE